MKTNNDSYYTSPKEVLEQGDIFRVDLVAPAADKDQRIFRSKDGRHGSVVFEENCDGMVFSRTELDNLLENISQTTLHTKPFCKTPDGHEEMVVVYARLLRYFIIATQTCDICGIDKTATEWAIILPVITFADFCKTEHMPFVAIDEIMTIHSFVTKFCDKTQQIENLDDFNYPRVLKKIVADCATSTHDKRIKKETKNLLSFLSSRYYKNIYMFSLPSDPTFKLPESYVDFTATFTIPTSKLLVIKNLRFVKISDPYRIDFSQRFGNFFARVALPKPMRPT